jgi:hypothetical protein
MEVGDALERRQQVLGLRQLLRLRQLTLMSGY